MRALKVDNPAKIHVILTRMDNENEFVATSRNDSYNAEELYNDMVYSGRFKEIRYRAYNLAKVHDNDYMPDYVKPEVKKVAVKKPIKVKATKKVIKKAVKKNVKKR